MNHSTKDEKYTGKRASETVKCSAENREKQVSANRHSWSSPKEVLIQFLARREYAGFTGTPNTEQSLGEKSTTVGKSTRNVFKKLGESFTTASRWRIGPSRTLSESSADHNSVGGPTEHFYSLFV